MRRICSTRVENRNAYRILVGKSERKTPVGSPRLEDNIEIRLGEV
jgi:hypothetical protein